MQFAEEGYLPGARAGVDPQALDVDHAVCASAVCEACGKHGLCFERWNDGQDGYRGRQSGEPRTSSRLRQLIRTGQ
jgi:hypothetical protein